MKKLLDAASKAYYEGKPFMSDTEFDILCAECNYEPVGYVGDFEFTHLFPMYSLQKVFVGEDEHPPYDHTPGATIVSPKLDGAAVSLGYYDGELIVALTRGDVNVAVILLKRCECLCLKKLIVWVQYR